VLLPEYKGSVFLPEPTCSVGFIENVKFEILTALLLSNSCPLVFATVSLGEQLLMF
jgi:hypothetical protein